MILIGISGHSGAGKDVVAHYLWNRYDFKRIGFSDALKHEVQARFPRTLREHIIASGRAYPWFSQLAIDAAIYDTLWWHRTPLTRALLQEYGTEVRRTDDPEYWVKLWKRAAEREAPDGRVVVPDVRFWNEATVVRGWGGRLLHIIRPHAGPLMSHVSEQGLIDWNIWDAELVNDGTIIDLEEKVEGWLQRERVLT